VFVAVENRSAAPISISRDDFHLVTAGSILGALAPDRVAPQFATVVAEELRFGDLPAGGRRNGFLYFGPVVGWYGYVNFRVTVVNAATHLPLGTTDINLIQMHPPWCPNRPKDLDDWTAWGTVFNTCLP
jgi:hypothetical protein